MATLLWATMVLQDARDERPPSFGLTLTTAKVHTPPEELRRAVEMVRRFMRSQLGGFEDLGHIEFTTGEGPRSGGVRRIHVHSLVKVPHDVEAVALTRGIRRVWERHTGAHRVQLEQLRTAAGAAHYLTHHHAKRAQLPPAGWSGRRYRATRGYFADPAPVRRAQAQAQLLDERLKRRVRATLMADGLDQVDDETWNELLGADLDRARALASEGSQLVRVQEIPTEFNDDDEPTGWQLQVLGPADEQAF